MSVTFYFKVQPIHTGILHRKEKWTILAFGYLTLLNTTQFLYYVIETTMGKGDNADHVPCLFFPIEMSSASFSQSEQERHIGSVMS